MEMFNTIQTFLSRDFAGLPFTQTSKANCRISILRHFDNLHSLYLFLKFRRVGFLCPFNLEFVRFPLPKAGIVFVFLLTFLLVLNYQYLASGIFVKSAIGLPPLIEERIDDEYYANPGRIMRRL